ncbi:hypothetical protein DFH27DRAFT_349843 [Peziza echinospora]|nr:hypothetical protein DFH27DRAFT_349843 [Peziza echinospora]
MRDVIQSPNPTARKSILTELQGDLSDGLESQPGMDSCRDILADAYSHANLTNTLLTIWRKHTAAKVRKAKITALRAEKRRILAEKEKGLGTQEGQWVPVKIKLRQGQDLVEQGLLFRDLNFGPVPIVDMFAPSLQRAFESRQVKNTNFTLLVLNAEPKAEYWWLRKFGISSGSGLGVNAAEKKLKNGNRFTVDRVLVEPKPPGDVGALVYGCRADYSLSNEERFARDKQDLHLAMDYALRESRYEKLAVMVVCYRSPLDTTDADPYGGDTERTSTEGRRARLKAIRKALDFSAKSHGLERIIAKEVVLIETLEDTNLLRPMAKLAKFIAGAVGGKKKEEEEGKGKELEAYEDVISVPIPSGETQKEEEVGVLVGPGALQVHGKPKQRVPKRRISSTSLVSSPVDNKKFGGSVSRSNSSPATTAARALRNSINGSVGGRPTPTSTAETPLNDSTTITQLVKSAKSSPSISINSNLILNNLNSSSSSLRAFNNVKQTGMTSDYFLLKASGIDLAHSYSQTLGKQNGLQHNHNNHLRKSSYSDEEDITTTTNGASSSRNRLRRKLPLITREHDEVGKSVFSQALSNSIGLTGASSSATTIISATIAGGGRRKRSRSATEEEDGDAGGEGVGAGARRFGSSPEQNQGAGLVKYYDYDGDRRKKSSTGGGGGGGYDFDDDPVVREARRIREAPEYHPELQFPELLMDEHGDGRAGGDGDGYAHHWPK